MTVGIVATSVLTDIANAIRARAGVATLYRPSEMAAAVLALDGTDAGGYVEQPYKSLESGLLPDSVLADIGDAIRAQNGSSDAYRPADMAAAILALSWDAGLKPRAVLTSDGVLEFNYVEGRRVVSGGAVSRAWEVDAAGYESAGARPWDGSKSLVRRVVVDASFASAGIANCAYWFFGFSNLVEVSGFENLAGITTATQMFASCSALETIYAASFSNSITSGSSMFYGCSRLVGGGGFVPSSSAGASVCKLGAGGVLTDPSSDSREWFRVHLYSDGQLDFTVSGEADPSRELLASGRMCANARYQGAGVIPGYSHRSRMRSVAFRADMGTLTSVSMDYWFYGLSGIASVSGLGHLAHVSSMRYAFSSCTGLSSLDFSGFGPSGLTDLAYCFGGCSSLATIYAAADWELPSSGVSGAQCFYGCSALVGGNGTAYSSSQAGYAFFRIDREGEAGYLTVR